MSRTKFRTLSRFPPRPPQPFPPRATKAATLLNGSARGTTAMQVAAQAPVELLTSYKLPA
eukprot:scaffold243964_cov27-Tisochrysis_lutea.AAC.1